VPPYISAFAVLLSPSIGKLFGEELFDKKPFDPRHKKTRSFLQGLKPKLPFDGGKRGVYITPRFLVSMRGLIAL
jgi:hypothetical protein